MARPQPQSQSQRLSRGTTPRLTPRLSVVPEAPFSEGGHWQQSSFGGGSGSGPYATRSASQQSPHPTSVPPRNSQRHASMIPPDVPHAHGSASQRKTPSGSPFHVSHGSTGGSQNRPSPAFKHDGSQRKVSSSSSSSVPRSSSSGSQRNGPLGVATRSPGYGASGSAPSRPSGSRSQQQQGQAPSRTSSSGSQRMALSGGTPSAPRSFIGNRVEVSSRHAVHRLSPAQGSVQHSPGPPLGPNESRFSPPGGRGYSPNGPQSPLYAEPEQCAQSQYYMGSPSPIQHRRQESQPPRHLSITHSRTGM